MLATSARPREQTDSRPPPAKMIGPRHSLVSSSRMVVFSRQDFSLKVRESRESAWKSKKRWKFEESQGESTVLNKIPGENETM